MVADGMFYEFHLRRFVLLYFLLGVIERELRKRVVITLGAYAAELGYLEWLDVVPDSYENLKNISMAVEKNSGTSDGIERHLPFAFWRRLFIGEYFSSHWVPALHQVFPSLSDPLSRKASDQVGQRLFKANQIRNRIAHFDLEGAEKYENEKKVLVWLINAMGGPSG